MTPVDYALLAERSYGDAPTVGQLNSASRMHVYGDAHVFRGSDDIAAWVADAGVATVSVWGLGKIHHGFYIALTQILPACLALPRPASVVGHSLGGALAIIYAAILAQLGHAVPVYAFEPPRLCGDTTMFEIFRVKQVPWFATRNGNDIVTQLPWGLSLPGALTRIGKPTFPFDNIKDHGIDRVIAALAPTLSTQAPLS